MMSSLMGFSLLSVQHNIWDILYSSVLHSLVSFTL